MTFLEKSKHLENSHQISKSILSDEISKAFSDSMNSSLKKLVEEYGDYDFVPQEIQIQENPGLQESLDQDEQIDIIARKNPSACQNLVLVSKARQYLAEMTEAIEREKEEILRRKFEMDTLQWQNATVRILTDLTFPGPGKSDQNKQSPKMLFQVKLVCKTQNFDREYLLKSLCPTLVQQLEIL